MPNDMEQNDSLPVLIIDSGKIDTHNLNLIKVKKEEMLSFIKAQNTTPKKVEVLTIDGQGKVYLKEKGKKFSILHYDLGDKERW